MNKLLITLLTLTSASAHAQVNSPRIVKTECSIQAINAVEIKNEINKLSPHAYLVSEVLDMYPVSREDHGIENGRMIMLRHPKASSSLKGAPLIYATRDSATMLYTMIKAADQGYEYIAIKKSCLKKITTPKTIQALEQIAEVDMGLSGPYHALKLMK